MKDNFQAKGITKVLCLAINVKICQVEADSGIYVLKVSSKSIFFIGGFFLKNLLKRNKTRRNFILTIGAVILVIDDEKG